MMKNDKFFCDINQLDICAPIISNLYQNDIKFVWQLVVLNDQYLIMIAGSCNTRLIRRALNSFLEGQDVEPLINFVELFLENEISDFPELYSLVKKPLRDKKLLYLFDDELSDAKKKLNGMMHQLILKFSS